jgi:hypothetical protein
VATVRPGVEKDCALRGVYIHPSCEETD